jgi:hypothetical protein
MKGLNGGRLFEDEGEEQKDLEIWKVKCWMRNCGEMKDRFERGNKGLVWITCWDGWKNRLMMKILIERG